MTTLEILQRRDIVEYPYPPGYIATPGSLYVLYCYATVIGLHVSLDLFIWLYDAASLIRRRSNHCKQSSKRARNTAKFVYHLQLISRQNLVYFHALRSMLC